MIKNRRLTLLDACIFIAATAGGLALIRFALSGFKSRPITVSGSVAELLILNGLLYATPLMLCLSSTVLLISLRRPRPPLRQLAIRPGFVMNFAAVLGALLEIFHWLGVRVVTPTPEPISVTFALLFSGGMTLSGAFAIGALLPSILRRRIWPRPFLD